MIWFAKRRRKPAYICWFPQHQAVGIDGSLSSFWSFEISRFQPDVNFHIVFKCLCNLCAVFVVSPRWQVVVARISRCSRSTSVNISISTVSLNSLATARGQLVTCLVLWSAGHVSRLMSTLLCVLGCWLSSRSSVVSIAGRLMIIDVHCTAARSLECSSTLVYWVSYVHLLA